MNFSTLEGPSLDCTESLFLEFSVFLFLTSQVHCSIWTHLSLFGLLSSPLLVHAPLKWRSLVSLSNLGTLVNMLDKACLKKQKWGNYSCQGLSTYWTSSFISCMSYRYISKSNLMFLLLNKPAQILAISTDHHDELTIPWWAICTQCLWVSRGLYCYLRMSAKGRFTWAMGSLSSQVMYF